MFNFTKKDISGFKVIGLLAGVILFVIILTLGIKYYFNETVVKDWDRISAEKNEQIHNDCLNLFYDYQKRTSDFSTRVSLNKRIFTAFTNQNTKKTYEALYDFQDFGEYNIEIYNARLELFLFSGRQVNPDILELKRALSGDKFSEVKEIGIYSYIVVFEPIKNDAGTIEGVLVTSKVMDIDPQVQSRFLTQGGIQKEIFDKYHIDILFDFHNTKTGMYDSLSKEIKVIPVLSTDKHQIGKLIIPNLDQSSYLLKVSESFDNVLVILIFALNVLIITLLVNVSLKTNNLLVRFLIVALTLIISRYIWLAVNFPARLFNETGSEIFSPVHFASGFAYGAATSLGELLISSLVVLIIVVFGTVNVIRFYNRESSKNKYALNSLWIKITVTLLALIISVYSIHIYGIIIQSLIYNSTIHFVDKSDIFSFNQPELILARIIITQFSISLFLLIVSCGFVILKFNAAYINKYKSLRLNSSLLIFSILILLNLVLSAFPYSVIEISVSFYLRMLILILAAMFSLYVQRQMLIKRSYSFINVANFSLILLACVIFVPAILLNKITAQENRYMERAVKEISMPADDKISFLIASTVDDITENILLENDITNKNKLNSLAFTLWASSKFYDEDLNSAIIILDKNKKRVSDFNVNSTELNTDSVITFTLRNYQIAVNDTILADAEDEQLNDGKETVDLNVNNLTAQVLSGEVLQNKEMKFYSSMRPVLRSSLRNEDILGYVIVASGYEAKSYLSPANLGIFKNFSRDNIISKLTSLPVISEFSDGELVGSSNKDVSKSFTKSLDAFRESVKDKIDKSALRYDEFENELYKSFYVLSGTASNEKIYVISLKVNDLGLSTFYFFRYLLFVVLIYLFVLLLYFIYKLALFIADSKNNTFFTFGFREKLFTSFLVASVIPIVILAIYTRELVQNKNDNFYRDQLISDLRIVEQYINSRIDNEELKLNKGSKKEPALSYSGIFDKGFSESAKNFNFYIKTKLAASTNEQLYKSDLLDTRLSGNAYYNLALLKRDYFTENQQIGDLTFIVGYKPIYGKYNSLSGIISSQTVFKQSEINQELTESLIYILGPYFTAVIILIFLVNYLSYRISNPILKLLKATDQLSRGNTDVQVKSDSKDEIGELVTSFNRMTRELKRSRAELKKAEREGAWRDIARQVAHEIKNPLTPMKLAMQHLYFSYTHGSNDFKTIIQTTNKLIIDQIETLNKIATEFSNFAKLPSRNYELLDINEILNDVVKLMNTNGKIHLYTDSAPGNKRFIFGDKDEVRRALINIIKNSMQAVEENENIGAKGSVNIRTIRNNGYYYVKIKDNGIGMDEDTIQKLFEPYFSTKSSGMGLGLVITKKILDDMKAKIYVTSKEGEGTEVEIRFRIEEKEN